MQIMNQLPRKGPESNAGGARQRSPMPERPGGGPRGSSARGQGAFIFQPVVTIKLKNIAGTMAVQPFSGWFDGKDVDMVQFKVEILHCYNVMLILETSAFPEEASEQWDEIANWTSRPATPGFVIVTAVSDADQVPPAAPFSRYVRWRVVLNGGDGEVCFRIKGMAGATFTQATETPRVV